MESLKRKELFALIKSGSSKQEIYDSHVEQGYKRTELAKMLAGLPSHEQLKKYRVTNLILGILLSITFLAYLNYMQYFMMIAYAILTYLVFDYKIKYYYWVIIASGFSCLIPIVTIIQGVSLDNLARMAIVGTLWIASLILSIILTKNLYKKPSTKTVVYENEHGQSRSYQEFLFDAK